MIKKFFVGLVTTMILGCSAIGFAENWVVTKDTSVGNGPYTKTGGAITRFDQDSIFIVNDVISVNVDHSDFYKIGATLYTDKKFRCNYFFRTLAIEPETHKYWITYERKSVKERSKSTMGKELGYLEFTNSVQERHSGINKDEYSIYADGSFIDNLVKRVIEGLKDGSIKRNNQANKMDNW